MHGRGDFVIRPEPNLAALRGLALLGWLALWRCLLLGLFLCCHTFEDLVRDRGIKNNLFSGSSSRDVDDLSRERQTYYTTNYFL